MHVEFTLDPTVIFWASIVLAWVVGVIMGAVGLSAYAVHLSKKRENPEKVVSNGGSTG